ncbi:hypothetical protein BFS86_19675 [Shewanella algae]|nr:hypothetical protein BFS86_19675 [Shewanella algae]
MTKATRERMERFINSFGYRAEREAVETLFDRYGLAMLTDEQVEEVVDDWSRSERNRIKHNRENRLIASHQAERMSS